MPPSRRPDAVSRKGPATRARIVDDAIKLASLEGLSGLTIGRLAERTGMSKSGLFAHFESLEALELAVLEEAITRFSDAVVLPAIQAPRGEPRVRALIDRWLVWSNDANALPGGCLLTQVAVELDDRPGGGKARDVVVTAQRQWLEVLDRAARLSVEEGHFRQDLDTALFAFQLHGLLLMTHHAQRLLRLPGAVARLHRAVDALLGWARGAEVSGGKAPRARVARASRVTRGRSKSSRRGK